MTNYPNKTLYLVVAMAFIAVMQLGAKKNTSHSTRPQTAYVSEGVMIKQIHTRRHHEIDFVEDSSFGRSKLYFLDSMVIFERERLDIFTLFDETSYKKTKIGYIFNKVASDVYYYYHTMSDTAALIDARIHHDTSYLNGTWHYKRAFWPALSDYLEVLAGKGHHPARKYRR